MKIIYDCLIKHRTLLLLIIALFLLPTHVYAKDVSFTWNANPEPLTGYKIYYKTGIDSGPPYNGLGIYEGDSPIILDNITSCTLTELSPDQTYHFVLTAFNESDESNYSTVVTVSPGIAPVIHNITVRP